MAEANKPRRKKSAAQLEKEWKAQQQKAAEKKAAFEKAKKAEASKAKDWRTNAGMQLAGYVWKTLGLEWNTFDMAKFEEQFARVARQNYTNGAPIFDCSAEEVSDSEARKRWQDHAASKRPAAKKKTSEAKAEVATASNQESAEDIKVYAKPWTWEEKSCELFICPKCGHKNRIDTGEPFKVCKCGVLVMMDRTQEE